MDHVISQRKIFGVDFSGASDPSKKIWIANGSYKDDKLNISSCQRAKDLFGSGDCFEGLCSLVEANRDSIWGFDFPFGLPKELVRERNWVEYALAFPGRYTNPDDFRRACYLVAAGKELKRQADVESRTPFGAYNLWVYKQTYYGLCSVLHPLLSKKSACILPMQSPQQDQPWILEVCPASTLKAQNLYIPYKGPSSERRAARSQILAALEERNLAAVEPSLREDVIRDHQGDALDSIVAAIAAAKALCSIERGKLPADKVYQVEGYIYS